jgi:hypothetical protein
MESARLTGQPSPITEALSAATFARFAAGAKDDARALLAELEHTVGVRETTYYPRLLPAMMRVALGLEDRLLAEQLASGLAQRHPLNEHSLGAARAQLTEHSGDHGAAATQYAEAAVCWQEFGNIPERAYAMLGHGRCLLALGDADAANPLADARRIFAAIGYRPAQAEAEALLGRSKAISA